MLHQFSITAVDILCFGSLCILFGIYVGNRIASSMWNKSLTAGGSVSMPEYLNLAGQTCAVFAKPISSAGQPIYGARLVIEFNPDGTYVDSADALLIPKVNLGQQLLFQAPYSENYFLSKSGFTEQCH